MTDMLFRLRDAYLDAGYVDVAGFWNLTLNEITSCLESANRRRMRDQEREEADIKLRAVMLRNLAYQITEGIAIVFSKDKKEISSLDKYYPNLFEPESQKEMDLETYTDLFVDFAWRANASRHAGEGGETDGRNFEQASGSVVG